MNYRDLLKYVHTGIAAPDMTYYDRIRNDAGAEAAGAETAHSSRAED